MTFGIGKGRNVSAPARLDPTAQTSLLVKAWWRFTSFLYRPAVCGMHSWHLPLRNDHPCRYRLLYRSESPAFVVQANLTPNAVLEAALVFRSSVAPHAFQQWNFSDCIEESLPHARGGKAAPICVTTSSVRASGQFRCGREIPLYPHDGLFNNPGIPLRSHAQWIMECRINRLVYLQTLI